MTHTEAIAEFKAIKCGDVVLHVGRRIPRRKRENVTTTTATTTTTPTTTTTATAVVVVSQTPRKPVE